jgi:hypothetical protein
MSPALAAVLWLTVAADLHVAPAGDDAQPGAPDRPVASLERAVELARAAPHPLRIVVHGGRYELRQPITLDARDSGLTIEGLPGETVVLSGGRRVTGWRPWRDGILRADLSKLGLPDAEFHELYRDGKLLPWARTPKFDPAHPRTGGWLQNAGVAAPGTKTRFVYRDGDLHPERWAHPERAWIMFHDSLNYETQLCRVRSIDRDKRVIEAEHGVYELKVGNPFYVCGVLEELSAPGEWCVDPDGGALCYLPPAGGPGEVVAPALRSGFVIDGKPEAWVDDVRIAGLDLREFRGRAIDVKGARRLTVARCDLRCAEVGVYLGDDTHDCAVRGCDITATQGDGVSIIGSSKDHDRVTGHVVDNCYIRDIGWGRIHNRCGGVYMHRVMRCKVTHNLIHDTPRYAIGMDVGGECEIAWNVCHHSNLVTLDTSIIEAATALDWGLPPAEQAERNRQWNWGNRIHHNVLHDSGGWGTDAAGKLRTPLYSWGTYLDLWSGGWRIDHNFIANTVKGAYMVNAGDDNVFENNLCLNGAESQCFLETWPKYTMSGDVVRRNVFAYQGGSADYFRGSRLDKGQALLRDNLVWAAGQTPTVSGAVAGARRKSWAAWLAQGQDAGTLVADPKLLRDGRLAPDSSAFKLGFEPLDLTDAGVYAAPERRTWPRPEEPVARDATDYTPPPPAPAQPALRDYEDYAVGESERGANVGEDGAGTVRVTDETSAGGKHSLKFTDAAGLKYPFVPYCTYPLPLAEGALTMAFDLRWERGAVMALEWRDDPYQYNMGPDLTTSTDGWLSGSGQRLLQLPAGQWVHVRLDCALGEKATHTYDLALTLPGAAAREFKGLACSPKFETLDCVVFMALAQAPSVFYLDNLAFTPATPQRP